jgi:tRNA G18 (ribose-2'-O)-methylase SpoU
VIESATLDDPRLAPYRAVADPDALMERRLFVAEGRLVVRRLIEKRRFALHSVLVTPAAEQALADVLTPDHAACPIFLVPQRVMNEIVGFNIHRGCLALAERPIVPTLTAAQLANLRRVLVLEGVNNPDNVGGLFRSAAAFGVDLVVLGPACSDPLYRKAIRTSMAAALQVPFVLAGDWPGALETLRDSEFTLVALTPDSNATPIDAMPRESARLAFAVGAEGHGLTPDVLARADHTVRVPMAGGVDSLNVVVAASIALHHWRSA